MHDSAYKFCAAMAGVLDPPWTALEIGSRNVNGSVRDLFRCAEYVGVDVLPGPGVDVVADGATFDADWPFDVVVCTEVLEHAADPAALCRNLMALCQPGGAIIMTAATPDRPPHSAIDGGPLRDGEPYRGVTPADLRAWLAGCRAVVIDDSVPGDVYCLAVR